MKDTDMPTAYSYQRFSKKSQGLGHSLQRQTEARDRWLADNPECVLDTTLALTDRGRSAWNRDEQSFATYALARFIEEIKGGRVKPNDYLIVESLDRLSRQDEGTATELFLSIVNKGVILVTLIPHAVEYRRPITMIPLLTAVVHFSRANSESEHKSERCGKKWEQKHELAAKGESITRRLPAWVTLVDASGNPYPADVKPAHGVIDAKRVLEPKAAAIVKRIFALALADHTPYQIAKTFRRENVPLIGLIKRWGRDTIGRILDSPAVYGQYTPMHGSGKGKKPRGKAIENYFPAVVSKADFDTIHRQLSGRCPVRGKPGNHVNLFRGLLKDARTGNTISYEHQSGRPSRLLVEAEEDTRPTFQSEVFERAILKELIEVNAIELDGRKAEGNVDRLSGELARLDTLIAFWSNQMEDVSKLDVVSAKLGELTRQRRTVNEELAKAQREEQNPMAERFGAFKTLGAYLYENNTDEQRERVQAAIRSVIKQVTLLIISKGKGYRRRHCVAEVRFHGGAIRVYSIDQPDSRNADVWSVSSFREETANWFTDWQFLEKFMTAYMEGNTAELFKLAQAKGGNIETLDAILDRKYD